MKILIVIDETNFYHPYFFFDLYQRLKKRKYNISVGLVTKVKKKNSIEKYLLKNLSKLYLSEILLLGIKLLTVLKVVCIAWEDLKLLPNTQLTVQNLKHWTLQLVNSYPI